MMKPKILVGTGWWCSEADERTNVYGDDYIRGPAFFKHWLASVESQNIPFDALVVDSNSPIKPDFDFSNKNNIKFLSLNENGGHAVNHKGHFCGWTRSVLMSMTYCLCGDYDYYVYVEQDALLYGDVIENLLSECKEKGIVMGYSKQTAYPVQVSLFAFRKDKIRGFLSGMYAIPQRDGEFSPENKIGLVLSLFYKPYLFRLLSMSDRVASKLFKAFLLLPFSRKFNFITFGYGRERPINFDDSYYYFQQGTADEIKSYMEKVDLK